MINMFRKHRSCASLSEAEIFRLVSVYDREVLL